jgi:DNA gyrase subunit A
MTDDVRRAKDRLLHNLRLQEHVFAGVAAALPRWLEVCGAVAESQDRADAVARVGALLDLDAEQATAVLDLQVRRFSRGERADIDEQLAELRQQIDAVDLGV